MADRLPTPRADGDREALRILLGARRELTSDKTRMVNRLRALLLTGQETDRVLARGSMSSLALTTIIRRADNSTRAASRPFAEPKHAAWRSASARQTRPLARRWTAARMLIAEAKFRRGKGYEEMPLLLAALAQHTAQRQPESGASA